MLPCENQQKQKNSNQSSKPQKSAAQPKVHVLIMGIEFRFKKLNLFVRRIAIVQYLTCIPRSNSKEPILFNGGDTAFPNSQTQLC